MQKRRAILQNLPLELLVRGQYQPRKIFDDEKLHELAASIKTTNGVLQPIIVRPHANRYEIIAGERRWRAAQLAGLSEIACLIYDYTNEQALQAALIENISRTDLNPIEEAKAYQRLIDEFDYLHEEIAASVGKSRAAITNTLRLLKLDPGVQEYIIQHHLSEGHGKILASLPTNLQIKFAHLAVKKSWHIRKLETEIKRRLHSVADQANIYTDANLKYLEQSLSEHLGNRTHIDYQDQGGGYMRIRFNNIDELEGHFARLGFKLKA